jgi:hypothetical protein
MTATVGTLLDDAHARTWDLCLQLGDHAAGDAGADRAVGLLAAWPRLATAALRVLDAVAVEPAWLDDAGSVRDVLAEVVRRPPLPPFDDTVTGSVVPDRTMLAVATRLGMVADLLVGQPPARSTVDRAAVVGLQANVVAVVHALAVATWGALEGQRDAQSSRWLLRGVLVRTERFAVISPGQRSGRYEDVAATGQEGSLDAALAGWVRATVDVLTSRQRVTQTALQVAAGDALILTAAAGTVCASAAQLGVVDAGRAGVAGSALAAAHTAWRTPTGWPSTVRLDGVRDLDQVRASRQLRQLVTDQLREGKGWLTPDTLADRFDVGALLGTMRRGLHGVGNVALAHFQAVDTLVRGPGRLWIAANAVSQPAYRGYATIAAAVRHGWVPMPPMEPTGLALLADARRALATTTTAVGALDGTAAATAPGTGPSVGALRWERGRIVAFAPPDQPPLFETVRTSGLAGVTAEQRRPVPLDRRPDRGPRR